jgi:hypothetical protein
MLRDMVEKHADQELLVLGDQEDADVRMQYKYTGWWSKMELFSPEMEKYRPLFFLDLDTYVLGDIRDIVASDPLHLVLIRDFYNPKRSNSGLMLIPKNVTEIWQNSNGQYNTHNGQDGNYLNTQRHAIMQNFWDGIVSYKKDQCYESPKGRIVCFHGRPKPHEADGWAQEVWERYK